jgi:tripartite-type tricarboxylate transporter receptor subunit TctC
LKALHFSYISPQQLLETKMLSHLLLRVITSIAAVLWLMQGATVLAADVYPNRPIKFIVSFPPGGGNDFLARMLGAKLNEIRGWTIVIENIPGAGGVPGTNAIAKAEPNGYTIGMGSIGTLTINPSLYRKIPFDVTKDIAAVSLLSVTPAALVVPASLPVNTIQELIALAKTKPGGINFGSAGNGTSHHLMAELFGHRAGLTMTHIPYAGSAPAVTGLIRGDTQLMFADLPAVLPQVRGGRIKALAVTTQQRSALMPDVPTVQESMPSFDVSIWYSVIAPGDTPRHIVDILNKAIREVVALPDVKAHMAKDGALAQSSSPEELSEYMRTERARWAEVIKTANVQLQ